MAAASRLQIPGRRSRPGPRQGSLDVAWPGHMPSIRLLSSQFVRRSNRQMAAVADEAPIQTRRRRRDPPPSRPADRNGFQLARFYALVLSSQLPIIRWVTIRNTNELSKMAPIWPADSSQQRKPWTTRANRRCRFAVSDPSSQPNISGKSEHTASFPLWLPLTSVVRGGSVEMNHLRRLGCGLATEGSRLVGPIRHWMAVGHAEPCGV